MGVGVENEAEQPRQRNAIDLTRTVNHNGVERFAAGDRVTGLFTGAFSTEQRTCAQQHCTTIKRST